MTEEMNIKDYQTEIKELENEAIVANTPDSWYHSKKMLYSHLNHLAEKLGYSYVLDGMIMDDLEDFRPGLLARSEEHTSELQSRGHLVCRLLLEKTNTYVSIKMCH